MTLKTGNSTFGGDAGRYLKVSVYRDGQEKPHLEYVHVLICTAFYGPRPKNMIVLHGDDNRRNNSSGNLAWGTQQQNILDVYRRGLR